MLSSLIIILASYFSDVDTKPDMQAHAEFLKPGAAVQIHHDYKGQTALNSFETISIDVTHIYQNGILEMTVLPSQDLDIMSSLETQSVPITPDIAPKIAVQFSGQKSGLFSLAVEFIYQDPVGQQSRRVYSIPVQIGNEHRQKGSETHTKGQTKSSGIIALKAKETVY